MPRITETMFDAVPVLLTQGLSVREIAARYGVTVMTLQKQCSNRGISLRPTGLRSRLRPLRLSRKALDAFQNYAREHGTDEVTLASNVLEIIGTDGIFDAVLNA